MEVHQCQQAPPWKALSDFALAADLDQAPFQQLVSSFGESRTFSQYTPRQTDTQSQTPPITLTTRRIPPAWETTVFRGKPK